MTTFRKASWTTDENTVRMSMDFAKVHKAKRLVSGFATLNNVDSQGDVVTADASRKAFERARGNLREMHSKEAVGKIVSFEEREFTDTDGHVYKGVFVTARVSEGAPNTWAKVLDGTLTGFSIGGNIIDSEETFNKAAGKNVRTIHDFELIELSLVDNPANQLANVFQIQKAANGSVTVKGMLAETVILNVFLCKEDEQVHYYESSSARCPVCHEKMENIGWIEDGSDRNEKVQEVVNKFLGHAADASSEGGANTSKVQKEGLVFTGLIKSSVVGPGEDETVATGHEEGDPSEVPTPARTDEPVEDIKEVEDNNDEPVEVKETEDDTEVITKMIGDLKTTIERSITNTKEETSEQIETIRKQIDELKESFKDTTNKFENRFTELDENLEFTKSKLKGFEKTLNSFNDSGAIKKSVDGVRPPAGNTTDDGFWEGAFS